MARVAVLGSLPESLINFRGPLLAEMVAAGHEVHAMAPTAGRDVVSALAGLGVRYHDVPMRRAGISPIHDLGTLISLHRRLRTIRPEYLLSYTIKPVIYGSIAAYLAGVPNVYSMITGLGYSFSDSDVRSRLVGWIARALYRRALSGNSRVFFQNPDNLDVFKSNGLLQSPEQAVLVNGSGVDLERFAPVPYPADLSFLMIARLLTDKGVREYADAAREMKRRNPGLRFRLAGWIDSNPAAISRRDLDAWIAEGVIEYLGHLADVRPAIADTAVYVLPSYHEGMPRTVLEAMAMARAVITTDVPGCRETVAEGSNGYLVPPRDAAALARAMSRFVSDPAQVRLMGAASRRLAESRFDVRQVNRIILETMGLSREKGL